MIQTQDKPSCIYTKLDNGVHHLFFTDSTRKATDAFYDILSDIYDIYDANPPADGERVKILFEVAENELPLVYSFNSYRRWTVTRTMHHPVRMAIISQSHLLTPLINSFMRTIRLGHLQSQFFTVSQHNAAIAWLLTEA